MYCFLKQISTLTHFQHQRFYHICQQLNKPSNTLKGPKNNQLSTQLSYKSYQTNHLFHFEIIRQRLSHTNQLKATYNIRIIIVVVVKRTSIAKITSSDFQSHLTIHNQPTNINSISINWKLNEQQQKQSKIHLTIHNQRTASKSIPINWKHRVKINEQQQK